MTPLYQHLARASSAGHVTVQPELAATGCAPADFLRMVAQDATLYRIDEAEFDTTDARLKAPEHFATFAHFRLPTPICWLEHKVYGKDGLPRGGRAAFVAASQPGGAVRAFYVAQNGLRGAVIAHAFDVPAYLEGNASVGLGSPLRLATSSPGVSGGPGMTMANFFFELVEFLNLPGLLIEEAPSGLSSGRPIKTVHLDRTSQEGVDALINARPGRVQ